MAERLVNDLKGLINLASDEKVINVYEGFKTSFPRGIGYFFVTNYRFIFLKQSHDWSNKATITTEIPLKDIGGIHSEYGLKAVKLQVIISIIILILAVSGLILGLTKVLGSYMYIVAGILFVAGLFTFLFSRRRVFTIDIHTTNTTGSILYVSNDYLKLKKQTRIVVRSETAHMIKDLGRAIIEGQTFKWQQQPQLAKETANTLPRLDADINEV